ncbi:hypothetical protein CLOM_g3884 [Closterium sp. NIES-68]|nr:hypothetical protein CLOM_g3884 [Closterium sp. NIES-68]
MMNGMSVREGEEVEDERKERRVSGSEKGPAAAGTAAAAAEGTASLFHANAYTRLPLPQRMGPSAHRREATARRLAHPQPPRIFLKFCPTRMTRSTPSSTRAPLRGRRPCDPHLHSTLFNLDAGKLSIFGGRSTDGNVLHEFGI